MDHLEQQIAQTVSLLEDWGWPRPAALLVSGSGLGVDIFAALAGDSRPLADLLPFDIAPIVGHPLSVEILGADTDWPILYQRGRIHSYQGHTAAETVFMVRLAAALGAGTIIQTNAAGSLRESVLPGELVVIRDHLNLIGLNPLRGNPPEAWGPRFPDMTAAYSPELREEALVAARRLGIELHSGIYAAVAGPSYETPAEVRMLARLGADLVGMSTALEVIAGHHMGLANLAVSMVSNQAAGIADAPLDHDEVLEAGRGAAEALRRLLEELLRGRMGLDS